jgi:dTDP-4-dehydrorhamnose reductase
MKKIIVTGANGQLGNEFRNIAGQTSSYQFFFFDRNGLNIGDPDEVNRCFRESRPDYVINCAAFTAVDRAETEMESALLINRDGAAYLATAAANYGARFIHFSTDYVFDGTSDTPLKEEAATDPVNAYGRSKLEGEQSVMQENPDAVILRTSWVYSVYGNNFVKTMLRLMASRPEIGVVADQMGSPTYAADLAGATLQIVDALTWSSGIYHYSNEGVISWYDFATQIKQLSGASCTVRPLTTDQYPTPAKRPLFSVMDKTKIQQVYGIQIKDWKESLQLCLQKLNKDLQISRSA